MGRFLRHFRKRWKDHFYQRDWKFRKFYSYGLNGQLVVNSNLAKMAVRSEGKSAKRSFASRIKKYDAKLRLVLLPSLISIIFSKILTDSFLFIFNAGVQPLERTAYFGKMRYHRSDLPTGARLNRE